LKRILFVNHTLDFDHGGAELVLQELVRHLDPARFECQVAAPVEDEGIPERLLELGISVNAMPQMNLEKIGRTNCVFSNVR
jgi:hypothetical protein